MAAMADGLMEGRSIHCAPNVRDSSTSATREAACPIANVKFPRSPQPRPAASLMAGALLWGTDSGEIAPIGDTVKRYE
jgi:hypothetical protein